ncbi:PH, RCC1 and FYVE domains-containing protein 1 [Linum grandiflorum]
MSHIVPPRVFFPSEYSHGLVHSRSSGGLDGKNGRGNGTNGDAFRVSLSSTVSSSSQGSGHDDSDAVGDVYMWGEGTGDGILGGGMHRAGDSGLAMDSFLPRPLESAFIWDVQAIACGRLHAAFVTKQGAVFTWGEELEGRLGHGIDSNFLHPKPVDGLKNINVELVACGEYHSCAVSLSGDLYIWGNSASSLKLNGYGTESSQWVPKKINGPLDGIPVSSVSCGPWHTAVVTSAGQLFTFGDGTFGVLGHGDRKSVSMPREVESLQGLRTMRVACGVWHTAAIVEVMVGSSNTTSCCSGKLFTWGDGDKGRLGHGDMVAKLVPTCVAALGDSDFCRVSCGHSMTVGLTTKGHVYTMGSSVYGQLGNPQASSKVPTRVGGKLANNFVEDLACGAFHVAVLTSKSEVYTWGKGANGRLGHGDTDDRNSPTLVEALKDKQVKSIVCGTSLTAAICLHKSGSGDQSMCSGCRLPFNFKRKRHNCYNCGLVFCHSCSSKKSQNAVMASNLNKACRVCDHCFQKLRKADTASSSQSSDLSRRVSGQGRNEAFERSENVALKSQMRMGRRFSLQSSIDVDSGYTKRNKKLNFISTQVSPTAADFKHNPFHNNSKSIGSSKKFFSASVPGSRMMSRATSPTTSRRSSPPRATTPSPILASHTVLRTGVDEAFKIGDGLSKEVVKLRAQVEELTRKTRIQEAELQRVSGQVEEAIALADEETAKSRAAKEVIKSLTAQLKDVAGRLPLGAARSIVSPPSSRSSGNSPHDVVSFETFGQLRYHEPESNGSDSILISQRSGSSTGRMSSICELVNGELGTRNKNRTAKVEPCHRDEWVEQDEAGVYITLVSLPGGAKDLKRVRFSRKRFSEKQAEQWWAANKGRVYQQYNVPIDEKAVVSMVKEGLAR